ncbi:hypothetical protein Xish_01183 [Xenorhabdus ishibashii]|uniref:Uncharacterized protein n=2 Tax=Xenorhabdus ishibashii TaxID=1034471 RepID=A0A2D0KF25_9GAMM|nr:hypothetical protein Xish_01183 [Xenorhabdus ishibashii]
MSDSLNTFVLLERIELISKIGGGECFNDKDRQIALYWVGELAEQVRSELIEKPLRVAS